ncbi:sensor histidine kinase [candidate division KSB1 bacterium]|nr:sensor histidine kinase [candidate division KSB1 bacterium]
MQTEFYETKGKFKGILLGIALIIIVGLLYYTDKMVDDLRDESRNILQYYAGFYASAAAETNSDVSFIFEEIIKRTYFPIIHTDQQKNPLAWKGIGDIDSQKTPENLEYVNRIKERMSTVANPIPIEYVDATHGNQILGYLYYGDSTTINRLRWLPYIQIGLVTLFILVGFIGFSTIKKSEERFLWVGMAKETAHQLGTPLSSLMGWIEIIRERSYNRPKTIKVIEEMELDADRLRKVAERFSQIGSQSDLKPHDVNKILTTVSTYMCRRIPQMNKKIRIEDELQDIPTIPINVDLMEWVFENLVKNAVDSINHDQGLIRIISGMSDKKGYNIYVDIIDNGRGIANKNKDDIFRPGFSTKKRGWGLGLNLAKRIVEEYHNGRILLKETGPETGTTMRVYL